MHTGRAIQPGTTIVEIVSLDDIRSDRVLMVVEAWRRWRGANIMPPPGKISPRDLGRALANISIARSLPESDDYEFTIIGDAHVQAYGVNHKGWRLTEVAALSPEFGRQLKATYDRVRDTRQPYALRGAIGMDVTDCRFEWFETVYLPFGSDSRGVESIMNAAVYDRRQATTQPSL